MSTCKPKQKREIVTAEISVAMHNEIVAIMKRKRIAVDRADPNKGVILNNGDGRPVVKVRDEWYYFPR